MQQELAPPGELTEDKTFEFTFNETEKQYESFNGVNVRLRYFIKFTILVKKTLSNVVAEKDFWVNILSVEPEINNSLKMEVGIEDTLHIEFEYNKAKYHLKRRDHWKDIFLVSTNKNKAHGVISHQTRINRNRS